jgi:hypothetical protein
MRLPTFRRRSAKILQAVYSAINGYQGIPFEGRLLSKRLQLTRNALVVTRRRRGAAVSQTTLAPRVRVSTAEGRRQFSETPGRSAIICCGSSESLSAFEPPSDKRSMRTAPAKYVDAFTKLGTGDTLSQAGVCDAYCMPTLRWPHSPQAFSNGVKGAQL